MNSYRYGTLGLASSVVPELKVNMIPVGVTHKDTVKIKQNCNFFHGANTLKSPLRRQQNKIEVLTRPVRSRAHYHIFRGLNQDQPYTFWVRSATLAGEGPESAFVSEKPRESEGDNLPATIASFSQTVTKAVKESLKLECFAIGHPKPDVNWKFK